MFFKQVEMEGLPGTIKFDQHGLRSDFKLEIVELKKGRTAKSWCLDGGKGCEFH